MQVDKIIGTVPARTARADSPDKTRALKNELWAAGYTIQDGDPVSKYLTGRGLLKRPSCLRTVFNLRYRAEPTTYHPAMLAMFTGPDGKPSTIHRTYLSQEGRKADVESPRRMMPGPIAKGGAVRLSDHGDELGIAEGIETAMSAEAIFGIPCWATLCEGALRSWVPPAGLRRIVIFGDNDENYVGQAAAYELARRLVVSKLVYGQEAVEVRIPEKPGTDWNDVWQGRGFGDG